jgi:hypothetical protein
LEQETKILKEKLHSAHPKTPLTDKEKQDIIKSLIQSFKNNNNSIDYKLIQDIKKCFPPCRQNEDENTPTSNDNICPSFSVHSVPSNSKSPTTTTPDNRPDALPCNKPPSASPNMQRFSKQQLHGYLGFRNLKNWLDLETVGKDTIKNTKGTDRPLELGNVANIRHSHRNTKLVPRPADYLRTVHMVIRYDDYVSIGRFRYILLLVDRTTRFQWVYGLKSMSQDHIIQALERFYSNAGRLPKKIYTNFDPKLISSDTKNGSSPSYQINLAEYMRLPLAVKIKTNSSNAHGKLQLQWPVHTSPTYRCPVPIGFGLSVMPTKFKTTSYVKSTMNSPPRSSLYTVSNWIIKFYFDSSA